MVTAQSAQAIPATTRCPSTHRVRAVAGKTSARRSADTLKPAIRALASTVFPNVPPYHALILMPNQAMAAASAARAMLATNRMRARGLLVGAALNSTWASCSLQRAGRIGGPKIAATAVCGINFGVVLEPESGG